MMLGTGDTDEATLRHGADVAFAAGDNDDDVMLICCCSCCC